MSFAIQLLSAKYLVEHKESIPRECGRMLNNVPEEVDAEVAERKLADWGCSIDHLTDAQKKYLFG